MVAISVAHLIVFSSSKTSTLGFRHPRSTVDKETSIDLQKGKNPTPHKEAAGEWTEGNTREPRSGFADQCTVTARRPANEHRKILEVSKQRIIFRNQTMNDAIATLVACRSEFVSMRKTAC